MPRSVTRVQQNAVASKASPPRKRWTRSQSRELEAERQDPPAKSSFGRKKGQILSVVTEESPVKSAKGIPESVEEAHNISISGTTILVSEPENDQDPDMMLQALPDLASAAKNVLDFLVPSSGDPVHIVNTARRLADPKNTQSKRLAYAKNKFKTGAKYFGGIAYIDVGKVSELLSSHVADKDGVEPDWTPEPILHRANCSRFALEMLLASGNSTAWKNAIKDVEALFPQPFMSNLVRQGQQGAIGESALESDTVDLAIEIRTQSLIIQLEEHQHDHGFDPNAILQDGFFLDVSADATFESSDAPLRGFSLENLGGTDGYLPARFREVVYDRFNEMRVVLPEDEDDDLDIEDLKSNFPWKRFLLRAARWIHKRCKEINKDLDRKPSLQDIIDEVFAQPATQDYRRSWSRATGLSGFTPRRPVERNERDTVAPSDNRRNSAVPAEAPKEPPTVVEPKERRKSGRPAFLNASWIERLNQREQQSRRQSAVVRPATENVPDASESQHRRQTLPASLESRPASPKEAPEIPASPKETPEIPASPEASPTLLQDEPEFTFVSESELFVGERTQLEKSHSPVMTRVSREPRGETHSPTRRSVFAAQSRRETTSTQSSNAVHALPSSRELWKTAMDGEPSRPAKKRSRAAFIDRQATAHRISPISQGNDPHSAERRRTELASKKRRRNDSDSDESDSDFTNYDRPVDIAGKRAEKPDQRPRSKRPRVEENEDDAASQVQDVVQETTHSPAVPESPDAAPRSTNPVPVSSSARHTVTTTKTAIRWTASEDARLVRLIEEVGLGGPKGSGWCKIARQNEAQAEREGETRIEGRNQVQLKDRARNLRIKYHRERQDLPKNFEHVTMKEKDYAMLAKRGINVSRAPRERSEE
ncbi:hypothetical protein BDV28DRAFT_156361 [Aspergillus coremiiformis]|uniref:Myb-like domain-containing protein n=1 Tax=Aspergillus coremiiformis TaxID=138285 RepID=A0A5N6ZA10_9EURO|nr:hypothetical protein BDV28DRAFT_156361 [Aspergillus coremiiformis]